MVSKARLDLPEPDSPVTTTRLSRGISSEMFLRLCTRAPCTATVVRAAAFGARLALPFAGGKAEGPLFFPFRLTAALEAIRWFSRVEESDFLHVAIALLGKADGSRGLADDTLVGQVFARRGYAAYIEVPFEVALDLAA